MLISKSIIVEIKKGNLSHYTKLLNIDLSIGQIIDIPIDIVPLFSNNKVIVSCDNCDKEKNITYNKYNSLDNGYFCKDCASISREITNLKRHGVEHPMHLQSTKDKIKQTNLEKYGVEHHMSLESTKDKIKQTNLERYGCEYATQNELVKKSTKDTNILKYGCEHSSQNEDVKNRLIKTNLKKYGTESVLCNEQVKDKIKQTNLEKYGTENVFKSEEIKDKIKQSNLEKYGVENVMSLESTKDKIKKTNLEKYGVEHSMKLEIFKDKVSMSSRISNLEKYRNILSDEYSIIDYVNGFFNIKHNKCDCSFDITRNLLYDRLRCNTEICLSCQPFNSNQSSSQKELYDWISVIYNKEILLNNRTIIGDGKEIDIYLPSDLLAIEYNGLYWHSDLFLDKNYHLNKTKKLIEKGIDLLHIWEDDWLYRKDIVKSIISNKLNIYTNIIYARKCLIKEVSNKDSEEFLNKNHIQGYCKSSYRVGLYYNDELMSLMTFGYRHTNANREFELIRFCNKINTKIIGGSSKLFNFSIKNNTFDNIITYCDISMFTGDLYKKLGFVYSHRSIVNYYWIVNGVRNHRWIYNKQKLIKMGYDKNLSENEIMRNLGYYKLYGCGQDKYVYKLNKI